MFNNLASYLLGAVSASEPVPVPEGIRLTSVIADDDWVLVDRSEQSGNMSESDAETNSIASLPQEDELLPRVITRTSSCSSLPRSSSCSSLPSNTGMEESWFMTPPPCFTSAGPIHMETSPLENLLIEHPSMSVYQHSTSSISSGVVVNNVPVRRQRSVPIEAETTRPVVEEAPAAPMRRQPVAPRRIPVNTLRQQQERQYSTVKNAQKVQIQKVCQTLKKNYLDRNNKAREVNFRNRRQRRGERSQGAYRSNANNNRKC